MDKKLATRSKGSSEIYESITHVLLSCGWVEIEPGSFEAINFRASTGPADTKLDGHRFRTKSKNGKWQFIAVDATRIEAVKYPDEDD